MNGTREELEELSRQLRQQADGMQKAFDALRTAKYARPTVDELLEEGHQWESWYAWRPVRDEHGSWHWLKDVYRLRGNTYVDQEDWAWYYYGTVFDILDD